MPSRPAHVDSPCLIRCNEAKQRAFEMSEAVKRFMVSDFLQVFNAQAGAQKCERAHRRLPVNSDVRAAAIFSHERNYAPVLRQTWRNVQGKEETFQCMEAVAVIVAKNSLSCSPEKSYTGPCCKNVFIHVSKKCFSKVHSQPHSRMRCCLIPLYQAQCFDTTGTENHARHAFFFKSVPPCLSSGFLLVGLAFGHGFPKRKIRFQKPAS